MVVYPCNLSLWEFEAGGSPQVQVLGHSEFKANLNYMARLWLKKKKEEK